MGFQLIVILNTSIADFIIGVYLLTIASYSAVYSGIYGLVDHEWRSSLSCSFVGSLAVFCSETTCFFMVILTAFRLRNVCNAYNPSMQMNLSLLLLKLSVGTAWLMSFFLSIIRYFSVTSQYFVHSISFSSVFHRERTWNVPTLKQFMCRYGLLSNSTLPNNENHLESIDMFLRSRFPEGGTIRSFGYYGETSVCMPSIYAGPGESSWQHTLFLITLNFLSFLFIAIGYIFLYKYASSSSAKAQNKLSDKLAAKMQKRIARIIATDFCCWIPICIMTYVRISGATYSVLVYQISAVLLLPINSAVNPFLFSSLPEKFIDLFCGKCHSSCVS